MVENCPICGRPVSDAHGRQERTEQGIATRQSEACRAYVKVRQAGQDSFAAVARVEGYRTLAMAIVIVLVFVLNKYMEYTQ